MYYKMKWELIMSIVDEGIRICENERCKRKFTWIYFELERSRLGDNNYIVNEIPADKGTLVYSYIPSNTGASVRVNCPYCDYDNHFDVEKKK